MTEEQFLEDVSPLPDYNDFYYVNGDLSLGEFAFSRAYFKFKNFDELLIFKDKFDDYVFMDSKGNEFAAIVEYAPLQKMPRRSSSMKQTKQDTKLNTIESDPDYIAFVQELKDAASPCPPPYSADSLLEEIENQKTKGEDSKLTPLLEYLMKRREDKIKMKKDKEEKKKKKKIEFKEKKTIKEKEHRANEQSSQILEKSTFPKKNMQKPQPPAKSTDKKDEPKATYVIKVKTDNDNKAKPSKPIATPGNNKEATKASTKGDKDKDAKAVRIRNKDRPAREIYRPGAKPKGPAAGDGQEQEASTSNKPTNIIQSTGDGEKKTPNSNAAKSSNQQQSKFKNRVFTRTKN